MFTRHPERKPSGPLLIQNRQSDGIAFDGVVGVMMIDLKVFRIGNQAKSPLSGQPLKLEDSPPHTKTQMHRWWPQVRLFRIKI